MLLITGLKDELSETKGEVCLEWKISDFFSLSQEAGCFYQSSLFPFAHSQWRLQMYPGGNNVPGEPGWISVYIRAHQDLESPSSVTYSLGIKKASGTVQSVLEKSHKFDKKDSVSGQLKFFQRSQLQQQKAEMVPSDDLTITCTLKHSTVRVLEETADAQKLIELERLSTSFRDLLTCKRSCDAAVKVKDKEFKVHRSVLVARSSVFASMFEHDMAEKKTGVITVPDCDPDTFGEFLHYLYTGKAEDVTPRSALHLYRTADKYDVKELKVFCVAYMSQNLTVENVCDVVCLAETYDEAELLSAAQAFFSANVGRVLSTVKWESLLQENYRLANRLLKEMAARIKIQP